MELAHQQPCPFKTKPLEYWTVYDVVAWVEAQGKHLRRYAAGFLSMEIDGFYLPFITDTDLSDFVGVGRCSDREWLLRDLILIGGQTSRRELKVRCDVDRFCPRTHHA